MIAALRRRGTWIVALAVVATTGLIVADVQSRRAVDPLIARMHADMVAAPTGDVDHDFADMMIIHHQAAVDMALGYLAEGHNERLRRLAQEIIVTQRQEIAVMGDVLAVIDPFLCRSP